MPDAGRWRLVARDHIGNDKQPHETKETHLAEQPPYRDQAGDSGAGTRVRLDRAAPPSTPRWVKVTMILFIALVVIFVILHLTGNGFSSLHGYTPLTGAIAGTIEQGLQHRCS